MSYTYSDPSREADPNALPDIEVFYLSVAEQEADDEDTFRDEDGEPLEPGWYYWECSPGCLPTTGSTNGPFATEAEAIEDAQHQE